MYNNYKIEMNKTVSSNLQVATLSECHLSIHAEYGKEMVETTANRRAPENEPYKFRENAQCI